MHPSGGAHGRAQQVRSAADRNQAAPEVARPRDRQEVLQTGKKDVEISRIEPVGQYAVQLHFSDGHDTGIYSWDLLYDYGVRQDEMWRIYLKRMDEAGASREPAKTK
jgi:DUF971 family protein